MKNHLKFYPSPNSINYHWSCGSIALVFFVIQVITGFLLVANYVPHVEHAFDSVENILRNVHYGWLIKYMHSNGAAFFFLSLYFHIFRNLYYYPYCSENAAVWYSGFFCFLITMGIGFTGYVLPWGQMSYWGVTVITKIVTVIPVIGPHLLTWFWGGFSVDQAALLRFFSLHIFLVFVLSIFICFHLFALHLYGSNSPCSLNVSVHYRRHIPLYPYYFLKDIEGILFTLLWYEYFVFFEPNLLNHPDNFIKASAVITPSHIVPEWYFLPFYAILRLAPDKIDGALLAFSFIVTIALLPFFTLNKIPRVVKWFSSSLIMLAIIMLIIVGWAGAQVPSFEYITLLIFILIVVKLCFNLFSNGSSNRRNNF